ncbi:MAG TPA: transcription elongation factor GreA, partial [Spirochaetales bacterium]|nr:transcription elongation factor GreA [Spirochaetales bacterium]
SAFETLLQRHKRKVWSHIYLMVRDREVTEDLFQEAFIKVVHHLKAGRYNEEGKFLPWVMRIAHNIVIDHFRRTKKMPMARSNDDHDVFATQAQPGRNIEQQLVNVQIDADVRKLIDNLPEEQREVVIMRTYLNMSFKEIENHRDTTDNRRINKQVDTILFKDGRLTSYFKTADKDDIERIFALISDVKDLDPAVKLSLRKQIAESHPDFKFNDEAEKTVVSRGLMVTASKYEEKNKLLSHIMEVDVPANQKEIAFALSLGDLRENAEYKAAKEKQDELNAKVGKLKNEIERAQIFDAGSITTGKISFATEVLLHNDLDDADEIYRILGPWESDPSNHVISYLSPLGKRLLNHKVGDKLSFVIHERKFSYTVKAITAIDL